jgi:NAD(P)-dependent dehydrogenase (short-subunit alcohol dehydrogenase family)
MNNKGKKVWLIAGCSSGFGRALAEKVLARGDFVVGFTRTPELLEELCAKNPENLQVRRVDLSNHGEIDRAVAEVIDFTGQIDVLINNAGYGLLSPFEETEREQMTRIFEVNFFSAVRLMQKVLPLMRARKQGHIINMSAAAVISNYPGFSIYGATKAAMESVSEAVALETKSLGIKITLIEPGPFRTNFIAESLEKKPLVIEDYAGSVGKFASLLERMHGRQPGDPLKAADAIIALTELADPPLRLVLGKYAFEKANRTFNSRLRELQAWEKLGLPTDF